MLSNTVGADGLVILHPDISICSVDYATMHLQMIMD